MDFFIKFFAGWLVMSIVVLTVYAAAAIAIIYAIIKMLTSMGVL